MNLNFRPLRADEVEARIAIVKENGLSLLLYKDARCDMNLLDETVGPMNWQKTYSRENANCTVSIWDDDKQQWISKEDTGTESFTEKEKGLASDSFKRACFNWGIGRELYTAPFIWITADKCKLQAKGKGFTCYDKFTVTSMEVKNGRITQVSIRNERTGQICYSFGVHSGETKEEPVKSNEELNREMIAAATSSKIDATKWKALCSIASKKGVSCKAVLDSYQLSSPSMMTVAQWKEVCDRLEKMNDIKGESA